MTTEKIKDHTLNGAGHPSNQLICWEPHSQKWIDPGNNYFCYPDTLRAEPGLWVVSARYGWPDGTFAPRHFEDQTQAFTFFVNFLHSRNLELQRQYTESRAPITGYAGLPMSTDQLESYRLQSREDSFTLAGSEIRQIIGELLHRRAERTAP